MLAVAWEAPIADGLLPSEPQLAVSPTALVSQPAVSLSAAAGQAAAAARPADGVQQVYALLVSMADPEFSLPSMVTFYNALIDEYGVSADQITYLIVSATIPAGYESIVDGIATKAAFFDALGELAECVDADDLLLVGLETHGGGYLGNVPENARNLAYHGYLYEAPRVNQVGDGDEFDMLESELEWSIYCGEGTLTRDYHAGLGQWAYSWHSDQSSLVRRMYSSHYTEVYVEGRGLLSDGDEDIDLFIDYALGDSNKDGRIDVAAGETADYDGDGIPCYDGETGVVDEDDWGAIDDYQNATTSFDSPLPGIPYHLFDRNLDNHTDVDLYPVEGGPYEVDGTDLDNNGTIDGLDVNDDGDMQDWVAIDETINMLEGETIVDDELAAVFNPIDCGTKIFVTNTCFGGGLINDLSGPKTIVLSGSLETTQAPTGLFPRLLAEALSTNSQQADADGNGKVSILEAFNDAARRAQEEASPGMGLYLLDDNGDGVGSRAPLPAGGDGGLAASTSLPAPAAVIISGRVWTEWRDDGQQNADEPWLSGWTVYLDANQNGAYDDGEPKTLTIGDGSYRFAGLAPGQYTVREVLQPGWRHAVPAQGAYTILADEPGAYAGMDFGNQGTSEITGAVWIDWNGDGFRDLDDRPPTGGVLRLRRPGQGPHEWVVPVPPGGSFAIRGLPPGDYVLYLQDEPGWQHTLPSEGSYAISLAPDEVAEGMDLAAQPLFVIRGKVWDDRDGDGQWEPGESPLAARVVYVDRDLDGQAGGLDWIGYSDLDGSYFIAAQAPGTYTLRQSPDPGWEATWPADGAYSISLVAGEPVTGKDFGNRRADTDGPGLFDPARSVFHLRRSNSTGASDHIFGYGDPSLSWREIVGDWDGVGGDTVGFFDPMTCTWYLRNSLTAGYADRTFGYGDPGLSHGRGDANWIPLVGDWDGDGTDTIGFFDPASGTWYLRNSLTVGYADWMFGYGDPSRTTGRGERNWQPLVGDWDGNGTDTVGFFDPENCVWYLRNSLSSGFADHTFACGDPSLTTRRGADNWQAIVGDWDGTQGDSIGFFDPAASVFMLRNSLTTGAADLTFGYGAPGAGWVPLVGSWQTGSGAGLAPPKSEAVDQIDLAALVARELGTADAASSEPALPLPEPKPRAFEAALAAVWDDDP